MKRVRLGVDVGGTFTDLAAIVAGEIVIAKVPSTPADQSQGVFAAFAQTGIDPLAITVFIHGMTVATNALLESKGARTAFVTTVGFRDLLFICRQQRPHLYDLTCRRPPPLVARELCFEVEERAEPQGITVPLTDESLQRLIDRLTPHVRSGQIEAIAVGLLFSFRYPEHEQRIAGALGAAFPQLHLSLSSEVAPEFREYERFSTAVVDAYLSPKLKRYLGCLAEGCVARDLPVPGIMQSSGGVTTVEYASAHGAVALLSGPAGGVRGAAFIGAASGCADLLTFDMGGTSTDVSLILGRTPQIRAEAVVAGYPVRLPQIDIHTVSAGGGSLGWLDAGGALKVGPSSAGSRPGPACYGRGGTEPTLTDANVFLGYIADGSVLGGELSIDRAAAGQALARLADPLDLSIERLAVGMRQVANSHMSTALRVMSVERGVDPRSLSLLAFGGAGPMHGCELAEALGIPTVLVPRACGVLSALGLAVSPVREDHSLAVLAPLARTADLLAELCATLAKRASSDLSERTFSADLRYRGQSFELNLPVTPDESPPTIAARFHSLHQQRYGWAESTQTIEVVQLRLTATEPWEPPTLKVAALAKQTTPTAQRPAWFGGTFQSVPVWGGDSLGAGSRLQGPGMVELLGATVVLPPGWLGAVDACGTLVLKIIADHEDIPTD